MTPRHGGPSLSKRAREAASRLTGARISLRGSLEPRELVGLLEGDGSFFVLRRAKARTLFASCGRADLVTVLDAVGSRRRAATVLPVIVRVDAWAVVVNVRLALVLGRSFAVAS